MLRRALTALVAACALIAGSLIAATPASADGGVYCNADGKCFILLANPPSDPAPNPDANGWTPGAPVCYARTTADNAAAYPPEDVVVYQGTSQNWYVKIGCGDGFRHWSNTRQCFVSQVTTTWPERPSEAPRVSWRLG